MDPDRLAGQAQRGGTGAHFRDRCDAGRHLASRLMVYRGGPDVQVLALPRGGVPVGFEVATSLGVPLDVLLVRKLGVPGHEELAFGALALGGLRVLNVDVVRGHGLSELAIDRVAQDEERVLQERSRAYRGSRPPPAVEGRTVIVVDDGLATGATMRAAVSALRHQQPARLVVAVPIAPPATCREMAEIADEVVCALTPEPFLAVGQWYEDFSQTGDDEVRELLTQAESLLAGVRG